MMVEMPEMVTATFAPSSRVWVYLASRDLTSEEVQAIEPVLNQFTQQWVSHNRQLKAAGKVLYNRALVLMVDESQAGASGCSIDSSVHFIESLGNQVGVNFFERFAFGAKLDDGVRFFNREEFKNAYQNGLVTNETLVFDNLVNSKESLEAKGWMPLEKTWLKRMV
ncbi:MAG: hypothetical protein KDC24_01910 [Saprospiraceae bacterium]|nr:hypothetical protein [Saprospiraceae bacterium]